MKNRYMFKKLTLSLLLVLPIYSISQIIDSSTIWSQPSSKFYHIENDTTIINGKKYSYIHRYTNDTTFHYSGSASNYLIREENNKIFWYDNVEQEDQLLYDFDLNIDDSIYIQTAMYVSDSVLLICENVDTINYYGVDRKRLTMRTANPSPFFSTDEEYWIWGIGSTLGVMNPGRLHQAIFDVEDPILMCCHKEFDQVFDHPDYTKCHTEGLSLNKYSKTNFKIYPNPANNQLTIEWVLSSSVNYQLEIKDMQGRSVYNQRVNSNQFIWNTSNVSEGIYILNIFTNHQLISSKKISIQH